MVSVHAPNKAAVNSPVKSSAPAGPARSVLPVHDEPARGRKPLLWDELAAVETKGQYAGEYLQKMKVEYRGLNRLSIKIFRACECKARASGTTG
jgi:hypothetical protein